jgi:protein-disulfide isomerase
LDRIAASLGLDVAKVRRARASHAHEREIRNDQTDAADLGVKRTPALFVNGRRVPGDWPSVEAISAVIDREIVRAQAELARGTPADRLYDAVIRDGRGIPAPSRIELAGATSGPGRGSPSAKVTIVELGDFQDPFTAREEPALARLMTDYAGRVRVVWHDSPSPLRPDAVLAAQAAMEAYRQRGDAGFWQMHDFLLEEQSRADGLTRSALDDYARRMGLDVQKWTVALDGGAHAADVEAEARTARDHGIFQTPTLLVNGYVVVGAPGYWQLGRVVDRALREAR